MKKNKIFAWLMTIAFAAAVSGCTAAETAKTTERRAAEGTVSEEKNINNTISKEMKGSYSDDDLDTSYSESDTKIELVKGSAAITGDGADFADGNVKITKAGTYVISGEFDGQIVTDVGGEDVVHIVLNGVNITNTSSAAINAATGKKLIITLAEGTVNTLTDSSVYLYENGDGEPDAALFVKNDLTINGSGTLTVYSNFDTGIKAKDNLTIISGTVNIDSIKKAIKGSDSINIENPDITINAEDDAITTDGTLVINSGSINIEKSGEGMEAVTIDINGGKIDIIASDDGINARGVLEDDASDEENDAYGKQNQEDTYLRVTGGVIHVNADADGIDSNGQLYIDGGEVYVSGPVSDKDGTLDYNGKAVMTGGALIGAGSQGMFQSLSDTSSVNYIDIFYPEIMAAGTEIKVTDAEGNVILSFIPDKEYSSAVIASDKLVTGETVTVTTGENSSEVNVSAGASRIGESSVKGAGGFGSRESQRPDFRDGEMSEGKAPDAVDKK